MDTLFGADDAGSTVLGVLLLVALTVMLAAVSSAFVLGLNETPDESEALNSLDNMSTTENYDEEAPNGTVSQQEKEETPETSGEGQTAGGGTTDGTADEDETTQSDHNISLPAGEDGDVSTVNSHDTVEVKTARREEIKFEGTTAILKGELTELADGENATVHFEWCGPPSCGRSDFRNDGINETALQTLDGTGEFTEPLQIEPDQLYLFRAVATVGDETTRGRVTTIRLREAEIGANISVETRQATDINDSTARLRGNVTELAGADNATAYFEYRNADTGNDWSETGTQELTATGPFEGAIGGFAANTTYEFRAVAEAGDTTDRGEVLNFTTDERREKRSANVSVETDPATDINDTSVSLYGDLTELAGADNATVYFEWGVNATSPENATEGSKLDGAGEFNRTLTRLEPETTYHYRAVAETDNASDAGDVLNVTTAASDGGAETVAVVTGDPVDVGSTAATLNGTITAIEGATEANVSFQYRRGDAASGWENVSAGEVETTQQFTGNVTGLAANATYEYRAVAETTNATDTGGNVTFVTAKGDGEEVNVTVETVGATDVDDSSATLQGEVAALEGADNATASVQYRQAGSGNWTNVSAGTVGAGDLFAGDLTGLEPETEYEFRALAATDEASDEGKVLNLTTTTGPEADLSEPDIAGQGDDATITVGDNESVAVTVTNVGDQIGTFEVTLTIGNAGIGKADSHATVEKNETTGEVGPSNATTVEFEGVTGSLETGNYTVETATEDGSATGNLTVEPDESDENESDGGENSPPEDDDGGDDDGDDSDGDEGDGDDDDSDDGDEGDGGDGDDGSDEDNNDDSDGGEDDGDDDDGENDEDGDESDGDDGGDEDDGDNGDGSDGSDGDDGDESDESDGDDGDESDDGDGSDDDDETDDGDDGDDGDGSDDSDGSDDEDDGDDGEDGEDGDESNGDDGSDDDGDEDDGEDDDSENGDEDETDDGDESDDSDGSDDEDETDDGGDEDDGDGSDDGEDGDESNGDDGSDDGGDEDDSGDSDDGDSGDDGDGSDGDDGDESDESDGDDEEDGDETDDGDDSDDGGDGSDGDNGDDDGSDDETDDGDGSDEEDGDDSEDGEDDSGDSDDGDGSDDGDDGSDGDNGDDDGSDDGDDGDDGDGSDDSDGSDDEDDGDDGDDGEDGDESDGDDGSDDDGDEDDSGDSDDGDSDDGGDESDGDDGNETDDGDENAPPGDDDGDEDETDDSDDKADSGDGDRSEGNEEDDSDGTNDGDSESDTGDDEAEGEEGSDGGTVDEGDGEGEDESDETDEEGGETSDELAAGVEGGADDEFLAGSLPILLLILALLLGAALFAAIRYAQN